MLCFRSSVRAVIGKTAHFYDENLTTCHNTVKTIISGCGVEANWIMTCAVHVPFVNKMVIEW